MEIWKDIIWYEWLYQISNLGNVKSLKFWKEKILNKRTDKKWNYYGVILYNKIRKKQIKIHRLVAQAFLWLDINNSKICVCHKNDIRLDNRLENLFLWDYRDNYIDCFKKWRHKNNKNMIYKITPELLQKEIDFYKKQILTLNK